MCLAISSGWIGLITGDIVEDAESVTKELEPLGSSLVSVANNLVDEIWTDRPVRRLNTVFHLEEKYSGK